MAKPTKSDRKPGKAKAGDLSAKRKQRIEAIAAANKITVILDTDVRKFIAASAREAGMDVAPYLQKVIEAHAIDAAPEGDAMAARLRARREVLDRAVALARKIDGNGGFDEHFILTVMREASQDPDFAALYEQAVAIDPARPRANARARVPLNQQLGRLIKRAAGAQSKRDGAGKIQRAQVQDEVITTYTLLERPVAAAA